MLLSFIEAQEQRLLHMTTSNIQWVNVMKQPINFIPLENLPKYTEAIRDLDTAMLAHLNDTHIGLDLETTGFKHWEDEIKVVQLYGYPSNKLSILHFPDGEIPTKFIAWMQRKQNTIWIGHRIISFDARFLFSYGLDVTTLHWWDTLVIEGIVNAQHRKEVFGTLNSLQALVSRYLGVDIPKTVDHSSWQSALFPELTEEQLKYAADDVIYLTNIFNQQINYLNRAAAVNTAAFELYVCRPVLQMATRGIPIDRNRFAEFVEDNKGKLTKARRDLETLWRGNPDSPLQVKEQLNKMGLTVPDTAAQTLKDKFSDTKHPFLRSLLDYRKASKLNNYDYKWLRKWMTRTGAIASSYNTTGTDTYRLSSREPNAQNYPRDIRKIFGHPTEWMVVVDYSTVEMRIAAQHTQDKRMLQSFNEGIDIHKVTASTLFNKSIDNVTKDERQAAKAANFAMIFGGGPGAIIRQAQKMELDPINEQEASQMRTGFFALYTDMREFHRNLQNEIRSLGAGSLVLPIGPYGHSRTLRDDNLKITSALNTPIQGQAAIGIKRAFIQIATAHPDILPHLAANVHDEIMLTGYTDKDEALEACEKLKDSMVTAMETICPGVKYEVEGSVAHYWDEAK